MRDAADFDDFYVASRARLLHQTYALTGDLRASQAAVRDAFVHAWHHWRKVSRLEEPERWVRPLAWTFAARRHTTRLWRKDRTLDPEVATTLEALAALSSPQRRVLLLTHLCPGSLGDIARELGMTRETAERHLQSATAAYALHHASEPAGIRADVERLAGVSEGARLPRATIIRRAGAARRRTVTALGAAAAVAAVAVTGSLVTDADGARPTLAKERVVITPQINPAPPPAEQTPSLLPDDLLTADQVARVAPRGRWREVATTTNTDGKGLLLPCQQERYADPDAVAALVRRFKADPPGPGKGGPTLRGTAVQESELSATTRAARTTYRTAAGWFAGCVDPRMQLLQTRRVAGVGNEATLLLLRSWRGRGGVVVAGVARTGKVTTTTVSSLSGRRPGPLGPHASLLAAAVNGVCGEPGTGRCAQPPRLVARSPLPVGQAPGMITAVDLPPVNVRSGGWVGTQPHRATLNVAATQCDRASFRRPVSHNLTRTFLIPGAKLPNTFGLTETVGTLPAPRARAFVAQVRNRLAGCSEKNLGTEVYRLAHRTTQHTDLTVWRLSVELSDQQTVTYLMAILRSGTAIGQIGFTPTAGVTMSREDFLWLAERALERLDRMPRPQRPAAG